ncbi:MAG: T9SS type A sorting domain-containing protein [Flavobacterium sp.]
MKRIYILCLLMMFSLVSAQTITFNGCPALFDNQNFIFNLTGTDATGRNIYVTTPVDGQACSGLGTCEFKITWNNTNLRWEFLADNGDGDFVNPKLIYSNASASTPNPPSLILGVWSENIGMTAGLCGGALTSTNTILTGSVQDAVLGVNDFAINKGIVLYPNPTSNLLNIKSSSIIKEITIWSVQGQKVLGFENVTSIDVSGLQSGMYITRVQTENGLQISNFIKR